MATFASGGLSSGDYLLPEWAAYLVKSAAAPYKLKPNE
jgi:hypothetical protein